MAVNDSSDQVNVEGKIHYQKLEHFPRNHLTVQVLHKTRQSDVLPDNSPKTQLFHCSWAVLPTQLPQFLVNRSKLHSVDKREEFDIVGA